MPDPILPFLMSIDRPASYYRGLFACMANLRPDDYRRYSAGDMAQDTSMSRSNAERALSMLEADGILICEGRGAAKKRRLSKMVVWRDRPNVFHIAQREDPDPMPHDGAKSGRRSKQVGVS